jgi:Anti-sigma factor NepR
MSSTEAREDEIATEIGAQLRFMYDNVLREPLPNKFSELMERLEAGTIVPLPVVERSTERAVFLGTTGLPKAVNDYDQRVHRRARMG